MFACMHAPGMATRLLACAQDFSPQVEQADADSVILNIDGLGHLFGAVHEIAHAIAGRSGSTANG